MKRDTALARPLSVISVWTKVTWFAYFVQAIKVTTS